MELPSIDDSVDLCANLRRRPARRVGGDGLRSGGNAADGADEVGEGGVTGARGGEFAVVEGFEGLRAWNYLCGLR